MKLFVTTFDLRPEAVRALAARDCDGIELRAETATVPVDLAALRAVTTKPLLLTYRGMHVDDARIAGAIQAGVGPLDVGRHGGIDKGIDRTAAPPGAGASQPYYKPSG